jgi:DNA-binding protein H-NS
MARASTLASMSVGNLLELREQIDHHLDKRRKDLEQQIASLNSRVPGGRRASGTSARNSPLAGVKVKPKYRGPKGETWAGRGVHPTWLAALLKEGHKIEEYTIGAAKLAAASKKVARKSSRKPRKAKAVKRKG